MGEYIRNLPADLWVGQAGSRDMFHSVSILSLSDQDKLLKVAGVKQVAPFVGRQMEAHINGKEAPTYVVAYDVGSGIIGPLKVVEGSSRPGRGEIIIDRVYAKNQRLKIGDKVPIAETSFTVSGIAEGGNLVLYQYSFINQQDAEELFKLEDAANYFLVQLDASANRQAVAETIKAKLAGVEVFSKDEFVKNNTQLINEAFLPIILVLVIIGLVVGTTVIGLTIFTSTIEKTREYGVLKAIGIKNRQLNGVVFTQALVASSAGYQLGLGLAVLVSVTVVRLVPEFITQLRGLDAAWVFGASLIMALLASYMPIRRIAKIDPAEVFK